MDTRRGLARRNRARRRGEIVGNARPALIERALEQHQFLDLLDRERQPLRHLTVEPGFEREIYGHVEQRARRREHEIAARGDRLDPVEQRLQIASPRSEEHTSELQSLMRISYAVFCLK